MSSISEMSLHSMYRVTGKRNSKALFRNLFHDKYTCSSQSLDRNTDSWGFSTFKILIHDSPTNSRESCYAYRDPAFRNTLILTTCTEPRPPKHKEAIANIIVKFSTPGSHTYLSYKIDRLDASRWLERATGFFRIFASRINRRGSSVAR